MRTNEVSERGDLWAGLLGQIASKSEGALAELYDRTSPFVYGLAMRMLRERCAAEDITQEVYMHVWRKADTFDPARGTVLKWMAMIARSRSLDRLRASKARHSREDDGAEADTFRDPGPDPEGATSESERVRFVRHFLDQLPLEERRAVVLAFYSDLSHSEIASQTGLPLGTVKTRIRKGMRQLREQLGFLGGRERREPATREPDTRLRFEGCLSIES